MDEIRLGRIEDKLDKIIDTQFTKSDMSNFMDNICSPSRGKQDSMEERLQKTEKLQARHGGMIAAVTVIWGVLVVIIEFFQGRH
jgi:hypothetical protein